MNIIQQKLKMIHSHLMYKGFPYHSVSVIHRSQDLGFHVFFMESVEELVTQEIQDYLKAFEFTFSFVKKSKPIEEPKKNKWPRLPILFANTGYNKC